MSPSSYLIDAKTTRAALQQLSLSDITLGRCACPKGLREIPIKHPSALKMAAPCEYFFVRFPISKNGKTNTFIFRFIVITKLASALFISSMLQVSARRSSTIPAHEQQVSTVLRASIKSTTIRKTAPLLCFLTDFLLQYG